MNIKTIRHKILLFISILGVGVCAATSRATDDADTETSTLLPPLIVTAKTRGMLPLDCVIFYSRTTRKIISDIVITPPLKANEPVQLVFLHAILGRTKLRPASLTPDLNYDQNLGTYGLKPGDIIVAVDGREVIGMRLSEFEAWSNEAGDAGDPIRLVVRGAENAKDRYYFREVSLKRVSPKTRAELRKAATTRP